MEGAQVYITDASCTWQRAKVLCALGGNKYRVQKQPWEDEAGVAEDVVEVDASKMDGGILPFQNANMPDNGFPNMTTLDHLHEPALLHNLRKRHVAGGCPYTYTADIVIAVNPYRWYPELYTEEMRKEYLVFDKLKLPPHAYATSSQAYSGLQETRMDQAILVSGESGAGKTETVKILMGHLALIASSDNSSHIKRIVESNPLLESFGNAQTVRNDNSSRFGKFIELELNGAYRLVGSKCRTYLLEKSRVVGQDEGERNYHIFYQMLAAPAATRASYGLDGATRTRDEMRYTRLGSSTIDTIEGKSDADRFDLTVAALAIVGVEGESLNHLLRALAVVLLLGQIEFDQSSDDGSLFKDSSGGDAANVATLLGVEKNGLELALTRRTIRTGRNEEFSKPQLPEVSIATRDAIAKELYSRTFDWLVKRICAATMAGGGEVKHFVGMLDIFGFESFAINRFEQLCINYANEKLQQKFTLDVFKTVQNEYAEEGIPWDKIEFKDNAPVLSLIEAKLGIIAMLNEECVRPKGADEIFVSKMVSVHKADPAFSVPKIGKLKELQFSVRHYAGQVTYTASGWLERNKDTVSDDLVLLMQSSSNALIAEVFSEGAKGVSETQTQGKAKGGAEHVATKFKTSLAQLMDTVGKTHTQYVRCIKPNKTKSPVQVDNTMVVEQLRCAGVIEAIRISRAGFPARMPLKEFATRFAVLAKAAAGQMGARLAKYVAGGVNAKMSAALDAINKKADDRSVCRALMAALADGEERYQIGRTRVYFKSGVLEVQEERRAMLMQGAATELSRWIRGCQQRRRFQRARRAALKLQANRRMHRDRASYLLKRQMVLRFQACRRALLAYRHTANLRQQRAATRLQSKWRQRVALKSFTRARNAAILLQSVVRQRACRKQYLKDIVEHKEQAKLENQVKALQARLEAQEREFRERGMAADSGGAADSRGAVSPAQSAEQSAEMLEALQALAAENAKLRVELENVKSENTTLRRENQELRAGQSSKSEWISMFRKGKQQHQQQSQDSARRPSSGAVLSSPPPRTSEERSASFQLDKTAKTSLEQSPKEVPHSPAPKVNGVPLQHFSPQSEFWEDVPCAGLPVLKSGSEVHVKFGSSILLVEENQKHLVHQKWLPSKKGYLRTMGFFIERRAERRSTAPRTSISLGGLMNAGRAEEQLLGPGDDGCVGLAFALCSQVTKKYVAVGGMFDRFCFQVTADRPEDAAVFTIVPMPSSSDTSVVADEGAAAYCFAMRLLGDNKCLSLRKDGYVHTTTVADDDTDIDNETMAASLEYLVPSCSYEITVHDPQIGLTVGKDLPLRVVGFKEVPNNGIQEPGAAERTGRVRIGDIIQYVNGQDIDGIPRKDVLQMIGCKRPVTLGFTTSPS